MIARAAAALGLLLVVPGCARALREPPDLEQLAGGTRVLTHDQAAELLRRADSAFAERSLDAVRDAAGAYGAVAHAVPGRDALVGAVRSRLWLADHEPGAEARRAAAVAAVQSAQWCQRLLPGDPTCDYWLGAALGVQARERRTTALDALPRIVELLEGAAVADPLVDDAGPDRALAVLYVRAPGWPSGPGDPDLALEHARRAVELRPGFAPNHLALGEALEATDDPEGARVAYRRALELARESEARGVPGAKEWASQAAEAVNAVNRPARDG